MSCKAGLVHGLDSNKTFKHVMLSISVGYGYGLGVVVESSIGHLAFSDPSLVSQQPFIY